MKILLLPIAAILLFSSTTFAQKIDLDRSGFTYSYRTLPSAPLPLAMRSFKVSVFSTISDATNATKADNVFIAGLIKDQANGAVHIKFNFEDILVNKSTPVERIQTNKDRDGKETRTSFYKMEILYTMNASCTAISKDGTNIYNNVDSPKRAYYTPEYNNPTDAQNFWFNNNSSLKNKIIDNDINVYIAQITNVLNEKIGYEMRQQQNILWITDSPKHSENDMFITNTKSAIKKLNAITATTNVADAAKNLSEEIKYFEGINAKYTSTEKPDVKLRYGAYYNLGMIYFCTDQLENAKQVGNALIVNDYDKSDGKNIVSISERIEKAMKLNNVNTTHFEDAYILKN